VKAYARVVFKYIFYFYVLVFVVEFNTGTCMYKCDTVAKKNIEEVTLSFCYLEAGNSFHRFEASTQANKY